MPKLVERWKCDFCRTHRRYRKQIEGHECHCFHNPDRVPEDGEIVCFDDWYGYPFEGEIVLRPFKGWRPPGIVETFEDDSDDYGCGYIWLDNEGWTKVPGYKLFVDCTEAWPAITQLENWGRLDWVPIRSRGDVFRQWREAGFPGVANAGGGVDG